MSGLPADARLLRRGLLGGDEGAARELYREHTPALYRTALRLTGEPAAAADLVHDTWLRAARSAAGFSARSAVRTWLIGILINRSRELRRAAGRAELVELDETTIDPVAAPLLADRLDLERAMALLPLLHREVLLLHDVEGHTHAEIADILGIEPGTSKSRLFRGRRTLARLLEPEPRRQRG